MGLKVGCCSISPPRNGALGRHAQALAVNRHALTLTPDNTRARHGTWVALEDAMSTNPKTAQRAADLLAEITPKVAAGAQPYPYLCALTGHVLAVRGEQDRTRQRQTWRAARADLHRQRPGIDGGGHAAREQRHAAWPTAGRGVGWHAKSALGATWLRLWLPAANADQGAAARFVRGNVRWWLIAAWVLIQLLILLARHGR